MKTLILFTLFFAVQIHAAPAEISGTITLAKGVALKPGGILFVFAKKEGGGMPAAVLRMTSPQMPFKFTMSAKDAMVPGTPFDGPFIITARYSNSGDVMDKSGPEGVSSKPITVGSKDVKIEMKPPAK